MKAPDAAPSRLVSHLIADGFVVLALLAWWLTARGMPEFVLPSPVRVIAVLGQLGSERAFFVDVVISAGRILAAMAMAFALGTVLAAIARFIPLWTEAVDRRLLPVLSSFPSVGWAMLALVWFPPGEIPVLFTETMILLPFCTVIMLQGLRDMDADLLEMGRSFSRSGRRVAFRIALPMLMPYVAALLKIIYGIGWKIATIAELFGADTGLGALMQRAQQASDSATVFAAAFAIVAIFFIGEKLLIDPLARRFRPYQENP